MKMPRAILTIGLICSLTTTLLVEAFAPCPEANTTCYYTMQITQTLAMMYVPTKSLVEPCGGKLCFIGGAELSGERIEL